MKTISNGQEQEEGFRVLSTTERSQVARMVLKPGESTGGPENRHRGSDQWLYVVAGRGEATVAGKKVNLESGTLLLIEAGEAHEIRNVGSGSLKTWNMYAPSAY